MAHNRKTRPTKRPGCLKDFKDYLKVGAKFQMEYHRYSSRPMPWHREVIKVSRKGVYLRNPTNESEVEGFLEFPPPKNIVWDGPTRVLLYVDGEHLLSLRLEVATDPRTQ